MTSPVPERFENVTAVCKANVYFDGKVVSHTLLCADGTKKTLGLIFPGSYKFDTGAPERMEVVAGECRLKRRGPRGGIRRGCLLRCAGEVIIRDFRQRRHYGIRMLVPVIGKAKEPGLTLAGARHLGGVLWGGARKAETDRSPFRAAWVSPRFRTFSCQYTP